MELQFSDGLLVPVGSAQQTPQPIERQNLFQALSKRELTEQRVIELVTQLKLNFVMTPADADEVRKLGGGQALIDALWKNDKFDVKQGPPLTKDVLLTFLQSSVPAARVERMVEVRRAKLVLDEAARKEIIEAGGSPSLLGVILANLVEEPPPPPVGTETLKASIPAVEPVRPSVTPTPSVPGPTYPADQWTQELLVASMKGKTKEVELLIAGGANPNGRDRSGLSPLMAAAAKGETKVLTTLLSHSADVNARRSDGRTALLLAMEENRSDAALVLIQAGADVNAVTNQGNTPLLMAALKGRGNVVRALLDKGAKAGVANSAGATPLVAAIIAGHPNEAIMLIGSGADVNVTNPQGDTPLVIAATKGQTEVVQALISHKADVNASSKRGEFPICAAARADRTDIVLLLSNAGADVNAVGPTRQTALMYAALQDNTKMIHALASHGARLGMRDPRGATPLAIAAEAGRKDAVKALVEAGADVNAASENGETPLMLAAAKNHRDIIELLIGAGAELNARNAQGDSALSVAATHGHSKLANWLLSKGATPATGNFGRAPSIPVSSDSGTVTPGKIAKPTLETESMQTPDRVSSGQNVAVLDLVTFMRSTRDGQKLISNKAKEPPPEMLKKVMVAVDQYAKAHGYVLILSSTAKPGRIDVKNTVLWLANGFDVAGYSYSGDAINITSDLVIAYDHLQ